METYDIAEHTHRFAVWTSARAVQRNFLKTQKIKEIIEVVNLKKKISELKESIKSEKDFDKWHDEVIKEIIKHTEMTYGRAAKILAIYIN